MKIIYYLNILIFIGILSCNYANAAGIKFKVFPGLKFGQEWTDNIYQDYSRNPDTLTNFNLSLQSNLSLPPALFSWWDYQLYAKKYTDWDFLDYNYHSIAGRISRDLGYWGGVEILTGAQYYLQPNAKYYNFDTFYLHPGIKGYITDYTIFNAAYNYSKTTYPNYVLDYSANGYSLQLTQEFSLFSKITLDYSNKKREYPEWRIIIDTIGTQSPDLQQADDISTGINFSYQMLSSELNIYYNYSKFESNATYLDYGPDLVSATGDEILIRNYYFNYTDEFGIGMQLSLFDKLFPYLLIASKTVNYTHRPAKDINNVYLVEKRKDANTYARIDISYPIGRIESGKLDLMISYSYENNESNDYFYNYTNSITKFTISTYF